MKKIVTLIIIASLFIACDKTENEQDILNVFFGEATQTGEEEETQDLITVKGMDFANASSSTILNNWGSALYADQMRYLHMRILYDCNTRELLPITLFIKIFKPNGVLFTGTSSPEGYTMVKTFTSAGSRQKNVYQELGGWGSNSQSLYAAGIYAVELWEEYDGVKKIFETTVQLW